MPDSTVDESENNFNQLVSISHSIFSAFDANPPVDVCGVFLDLSQKIRKSWCFSRFFIRRFILSHLYE